MAIIGVQEAPFDPGTEIAKLLAGRTDIGGLGCFLGTVRGTASGRSIVAMTLEHYPAMTEKALTAIASEAEARWPLLGCTIIHRTGRLLPGDPIVLVATASSHRQAALDSTAFLIDWLKTKAPFWKKEEYADGDTAWVSAKDTDHETALRWAIPGQLPQLPATGENSAG
jgi:molybdopterin synthase catalytic subunit